MTELTVPTTARMPIFPDEGSRYPSSRISA